MVPHASSIGQHGLFSVQTAGMSLVVQGVPGVHVIAEPLEKPPPIPVPELEALGAPAPDPPVPVGSSSQEQSAETATKRGNEAMRERRMMTPLSGK
jgi:hypothetical protein